MDFVTCGADPCLVLYEETIPRKRDTPSSKVNRTCHVDDDVSSASDVQDRSKNALDNIQRTLEEQPRVFLNAPETPPPVSRTSRKMACSPSPNMLNPLPKTPQWSERNDTLPILPPDYSSNSTSYGLEILTNRLQVGYDVCISEVPGFCCLEQGPAVLSLSEDRKTLFLLPNEADPKGYRQVQIQTSDIHRIDHGRTKAAGAFSIVVEEHPGNYAFYDLVAANAIDREVMVTTILLILDQVFEGTLEQPIPCSPSLDQKSSTFAETSLSVSGSLDDVKGEPYKEQTSDLVGAPSSIHCAPSGSSIKPTNSTQVPNSWCATDVCSSALIEITDTCSGIFAIKQRTSCFAPEQILVEEFIATALGAPDVFYKCMSKGHYWDKDDVVDRNISTRHRASRLNAQAARLRALRNEMSFSAALQQSKSRMKACRSVNSFDSTAIGKQSQAADKAANQIHNSPLMGSIIGRMAFYDDNGETRESDGGLYYDSDPEDYRFQTRKPRNVQNPSESFEERSIIHVLDSQKAVFPPRLSRKLDDDSIREVSQAMFNERMELLWHPTQSAACPNRSPLGVKVWFESGVYLNSGNILLPKLTWAKASSNSVLQRLDLLEICRICPVEHVDRKRHPFVLSQLSFYVETQSDLVIFQAHSTEERDRFVFSWKLVVARLASLLMLRDIRAAEEFFATSSVPGEPPEWTG